MDYPKYYLRRQKIDENKRATVFRRNYLNFKDFVETENGWELEERFECLGIDCYLKLILRRDSIYEISQYNTPTLMVRGVKKQFGFYMRFGIKEVPFTKSRENDGIYCYLECTGKGFPEDAKAKALKEQQAAKAKALKEQKAAKKKKKAKMSKRYKMKFKKGSSRDQVAPYTTAGYYMTHPYSGGAVSPR